MKCIKAKLLEKTREMVCATIIYAETPLFKIAHVDMVLWNETSVVGIEQHNPLIDVLPANYCDFLLKYLTMMDAKLEDGIEKVLKLRIAEYGEKDEDFQVIVIVSEYNQEEIKEINVKWK